MGLIGLLPALCSPSGFQGGVPVLFSPLLPSVLFSGTEKVRACSYPVAYPLISSVSTCKVGEHFAYVPKLPHYLFSKVCSLVSDYFSLPPCFSRKGREKRMHHFLHFLPELLSLLSSFSLDSLNQRYTPKSVAHTHHSPKV